MLKTPEIDTQEWHGVPSLLVSLQKQEKRYVSHSRERLNLLKQLTRFGLVGSLNTLIDLLILNLLLLLLPTTSTLQILLYNALAYSAGAVNSFVCNKYWTFKQRQSVSRRELAPFVLTTLLGMSL